MLATGSEKLRRMSGRTPMARSGRPWGITHYSFYPQLRAPRSGQFAHSHPKLRLVARIVTGIVRREGFVGSILILGDSTCAHCFDRTYEASRWSLQKHINSMLEGCAEVYFACVSGAGLKHFASQARDMTRYGENCYDYVLVVGGWNSSWESEAHVAESITEIMAFCHSKILIN